MKTLFTLTKRGSRIEVTQNGFLVCFATMNGSRTLLSEWIIKKDLEQFTQFLINNGYTKSN